MSAIANKLKIFLFALIILIVAIVVFFLWMTRPMCKPIGYFNPLSAEHLIAHGGGAIDGYTYTNSREALLRSLDVGYRFVELDLFVTSDGDVVCLHNLVEFNKMTNSNVSEIDSKTFKGSKLYGKYTPLALEDAIKIWEERPFYFVTDNISDVEILNRYFKGHRNKVIVEAFSPDDYADLNKQGYWPMLNVIGNWIGLKRYLLASIKSGCLVDWIVSGSQEDYHFYRFVKRMGTKVATFTENDVEYIKRYVGREVDLVYTDSVGLNE